MKVITESGSIYVVESAKTKTGNVDCLLVKRTDPNGQPSWESRCLAVYPDRLDNFINSSKFQMVNGKVVGYNKAGKITMQLFAKQVKPGMVLAAPNGFKSTKIIKVV